MNRILVLHPKDYVLKNEKVWYSDHLENKYGKQIKDLFLVRLHPDAEEKNYELINLPDLSVEINDLFLEIKK